MTANQIPEAAVDALYDELFRVGRYLHAPVPIDPKEIIRRHLTAAQQQRQATPPSAPVGVDDELRVQAALLRTPEFMAQFDPEKFARQLERIAAALAAQQQGGAE